MASSVPAPTPESFFCPITGEIMEDPVMCDDGHSYERTAIQRWLQQPRGVDEATGWPRAPRSPMTNLALRSVELRPNIALQGAIEAWLQIYPHLRMKAPRMSFDDVRAVVEGLHADASAKQGGWKAKLAAKDEEIQLLQRELEVAENVIERQLKVANEAVAKKDREISRLKAVTINRFLKADLGAEMAGHHGHGAGVRHDGRKGGEEEYSTVETGAYKITPDGLPVDVLSACTELKDLGRMCVGVIVRSGGDVRRNCRGGEIVEELLGGGRRNCRGIAWGH